MHHAKLESSERLIRVDKLLSDGKERSTLEIIQKASVCAVNSIISELRQNGKKIKCARRGNVWFYQYQEEIQNAN